MLSVLCVSLHRAAVLAVLAAGQRAPSEPWWGPWQPRPSGCPLEPVPRRSKRGPAWYKRRASALVSLPPEARALGRLNRGCCVGYNETGARLQRERGPGYNGRLFRRIRLGSCLSRWPQSVRSSRHRHPAGTQRSWSELPGLRAASVTRSGRRQRRRGAPAQLRLLARARENPTFVWSFKDRVCAVASHVRWVLLWNF